MLSLAVIVVGAGAPFIWVKGDAVIPGVWVNGIAAGGKTRAELTELFRQKNGDLAGRNWNLRRIRPMKRGHSRNWASTTMKRA